MKHQRVYGSRSSNARPRPAAPLRSVRAGALGDLGPACAPEAPLSSAAVFGRAQAAVQGWWHPDVCGVLRADGLLDEAALEGAAERRIAVRQQELVQAFDVIKVWEPARDSGSHSLVLDAHWQPAERPRETVAEKAKIDAHA